jgi:hypothetical protein
MTNLSIVDSLNNIISKLTAMSDFSKRLGDDSYLLEEETPLGFHLIMVNCIDDLKSLSNKIASTV